MTLEKQKQAKRIHQNKNQNKKQTHDPVLFKEVLAVLNPKKGESYLDLTAGYGGHASMVIDKTGRPDLAVLVDRDKQAIDELMKIIWSKRARDSSSGFLLCK